MKINILQIVAALFLAFIIVLICAANTNSNFPLFNVLENLPFGDKLMHFVLLGTLTLLLNLATGMRRWQIGNVRILAASGLIWVAITAEEFSQRFNPNRSFDWADMGFNWLGIVVFSLLAVWIDRQRQKRLPPARHQTS